MADVYENPEEAARTVWTLRLAGSQEDVTPGLWAPDARASGLERLPGLFARSSGLMLAAFTAVLGLGFAWALTMQPEHEATLRLIVQPAGAANGLAALMPLSAAELEEEAASIRGAANLTGDEASRLRVEPLPDSSVLEIAFRDVDPRRAAATVEALARHYAAGHAQARAAAAARLSFEEERAQLEAEAEDARRALARFRQRNRASQLERQKQAEQAHSTELAAERKTIEAQIEEWEERRSAAGNRFAVQAQIDRLRQREQNIRDEMRASQARHSHIEQLVAQQAQLEQAVFDAEEKTAGHSAKQPRSADGEPRLEVTLPEAGRASVRPTQLEPWVILLLGMLGATCAAVAAAFAAAPYRRPAAYVADITEATEAPLLRMIEERRSHVS